jgi:FkbM family methyltransferase
MKDVVLTFAATVRRALPASVRRRIRVCMFQWLDQTWQLPTGVFVRVGSYGEWTIYNEIFVNADYDGAIERALDGAAVDRPFRVLDLGAHVGYFTLRVVDRLRRRPDAIDFAMTLVEGGPFFVDELRRRVTHDNALGGRVTVVHGLAGERSGTATLHGNGSIFPSIIPRGDQPGPRIPFVDLHDLVPPDQELDLLKCDIEGAELLVVQNYAPLLERTRVAVFELHHDWCDTRLVRQLVHDAGLRHHAVLRDSPANFIYCVWR